MVDGAPVRARDPVLDRGDVTTRPANASPVDPAFPLVTGVVTAGVVPIVVSVVGDEVPGADSSTTVVAAVAWRPDRRPVAVSEWLPASTSGTENVSVVPSSYRSQSGSVTLGPGQLEATFAVEIIDNAQWNNETQELVHLSLTSADQSHVYLGELSTTTISKVRISWPSSDRKILTCQLPTCSLEI